MAGQTDKAVEYFRAVLVSAGVLPVRDEYMAQLERWIERKLATINDTEDRKLITAFARWDRIARLRRRSRGKAISVQAADIIQTQIAKAIALLRWIKDQAETLGTCQQTHIDLWLTSEDHQGPYSARPFVTWAVRSKFAFNISIPARPRRVFHRPLEHRSPAPEQRLDRDQGPRRRTDGPALRPDPRPNLPSDHRTRHPQRQGRRPSAPRDPVEATAAPGRPGPPTRRHRQ
ncbi:hypothetical protein ABZS61_34010 [Streptomyces sp. NPDC005566]|uniref:hypothetical protein n=1 Tax=Streptomyces sp. NPDC005566 TaxID=3156886 RepID=UPI0033AF54AF